MAQASSHSRGTKRHCQACGANYYDLERSPAICPKCHTEFVANPRLLPAAARSARSARPQPDLVLPDAGKRADEFEEDEVLATEEHEDEEGIIDDRDGGDERDEMRD